MTAQEVDVRGRTKTHLNGTVKDIDVVIIAFSGGCYEKGKRGLYG